MAVVVPARVPELGIAAVFKPLFPLFPPDALTSMKRSGMFALSEPGELDDVLAAVELNVRDDNEIEWHVVFDDPHTATRAVIGAGPMQLAIQQSGEQAITEAVEHALAPFTGPKDRITLPAWWRARSAWPRRPSGRSRLYPCSRGHAVAIKLRVRP